MGDEKTLKQPTQTLRKRGIERERSSSSTTGLGEEKKKRKKKKKKRESRKTWKEKKKNWYVEQLSFCGMHYDD